MLREAGGKVTLSGESALAAVAKSLPPEYRYHQRSRVDVACQRVLAIERLRTAVEGHEEEEAVIAAWRRVAALGCAELAGEAWRKRVELAEKRVPLVRAIREISRQLPADQLDGRLLAAWKPELLDGCADVESWRAAYELAARRQDLLRRIAKAIRRRHDAEIVRLMEDPSLAGYPLRPEWSAAIEAARSRVGKTAALVAMVQSRDAASFWHRFDARLIRRHQDLFGPYEALLRRLTEKEILPLDRLGLGPALARASLVCVDWDAGIYHVRWTWPQQRFSEECILAICPQAPGPGDDPGEVSVYYRLPIDRASWEAGGGSRQVHVSPEWREGYVAVWALVDLGFQRFASHPLVLGSLQDAAGAPARGRKGWRPFAGRGTRDKR
jgi:hypothetical protein